ncbi:MAG TPA: NAD-dependent epimerase/dehydratase family protein [Rectinemataceae bacterium]|nr:NAD-dependent epimerase/dehydratase family protein [Rectinemataceae bacterium]
MKTVLLTGAEGFIGRNMKARLGQRSDIRLLCIDVGNTKEELAKATMEADFVIHLAGVNRPKDLSEFEIGNKGLTEELVDLLLSRESKIPLLISSSIQAALDNPYGKSKLGAEEAIREYGRATGAAVYIFRLPNVFGKWCRPNYNSVIATWCHNTARGLPIQINNPETELHLVYVDDVAEGFIAALDGTVSPDTDGFCRVSRTYKKTLAQVAGALESFAASRKTLVMPSLEDSFTRALYATWLSYLPGEEFSYPLEMKRDDRGWLAEFIKSPSFGQVFVSKTKPGITRGNHWHHTKVEKFLVISGKALIRFRKIGDKNILEYPVSGDELRVVDIPVGYTHSITNIGETELITLFWADEIFNSAAPDTYFLGV